jgi:uncharacterized membrane protein YjfL (UPF0719 family)
MENYSLSTLAYFLILVIIALTTVFGAMLLISVFTREIDEKKEIIEKKNIAAGIVFLSFFWSVGMIIFETISPIMQKWYDLFSPGLSFLLLLRFLLFVLIVELGALLISVVIIYFSLKLIHLITRNINEWEEIKNQNVSLALVMGAVIIFLGYVFKSFIVYWSIFLGSFIL